MNWRNPGYPNTYSTVGTCEWKIAKVREDICQIRLDFQTLVLADPNGTLIQFKLHNPQFDFLFLVVDNGLVGKCEKDSFQVGDS